MAELTTSGAKGSESVRDAAQAIPVMTRQAAWSSKGKTRHPRHDGDFRTGWLNAITVGDQRGPIWHTLF